MLNVNRRWIAQTIGPMFPSFSSFIMTVVLLAVPLIALPSHSEGSRELILAAYSVPKEAYETRIIPAFKKYWKEKTGQDVQVRSSYAASGAQARAIIGGFEADVAALSIESDVDQVAKAGLISHDWRKGPHKGIITTSVVAFGVRKGNPKGIKTWEDLTKPGIEVLYPNPKTSGGAMWDIIAIYGAGLKLAPSGTSAETYATALVKRIQKNVKVMDKSGRESVTTFERGIGDVIVTYENELLPRIKGGRPYDLVVPAETVEVENPIALVDRNADKHKVRDVADAFVAFLHTEGAQRAFVDLGFRPMPDAAGAHGHAGASSPAKLFTIADLGGWNNISTLIFGPQGVWTRAVEDLARGR